ncbi:MAG: DUF3127 domain-containing protein, partial [Flavobacteriales bacterium]
MESLKIEGKLKRIKDVQQITDTFKKREFAIETDEQYPQIIGFETIQDKVGLIDGFQVGEMIEVFFNLRGREWQKDANSEVRVFNSLHAWRIQKLQNDAPATDLPAASSES